LQIKIALLIIELAHTIEVLKLVTKVR
jgi:hypothetical protein